MTNSRLKLNRFLVFNNKQIIYDENFHDGINVIRGEHSVGKSTLFDLIYFVLGGELKEEEWKYPVDQCTEVRAEIEVNNKIVTLAREISVGGVSKIRIFDGSYEKAARDSENWLSFGARRSKNKVSFSETMFDLFGWGQQKTESFNSLTMHQILRLSYLSQSSKTTNIFREEIDRRGDSGSTRKAIAEFLLGLDDLTSYDKRQQKLQKEIELIKIQSNRDNLIKRLGDDSEKSVKELESLIRDEENKIIELTQERDKKLQNTEENSNSSIIEKRKQIIEEIKKYTEEISLVSNRISLIQKENTDCELFAKSLKFRIKSLGESEDTYRALGNISFNYCPSCFSQLEENIDNDQCALCKNKIPNSELSEKYTETLTELKYQEKQNINTINMLQAELHTNNIRYTNNNEKLFMLQNELSSISVLSNEREFLIADYTKQISYIESEISVLNQKIPLIQELDDWKNKIITISGEITKLEIEIADLVLQNKKRNESVIDSLSVSAATFLENGTGNENDFITATEKEIEIDFEKDRWLLGGRVSFSESSNAEKRSALHISFLLQALEDKQTRYPLFSIMDFECADLNEERSQKIQNNILDLVKDNNEFQLLITSSKIAKELDNEELGVGRFYKKNDYIFKIE